jgi:hypothetical protein
MSPDFQSRKREGAPGMVRGRRRRFRLDRFVKIFCKDNLGLFCLFTLAPHARAGVDSLCITSNPLNSLTLPFNNISFFPLSEGNLLTLEKRDFLALD